VSIGTNLTVVPVNFLPSVIATAQPWGLLRREHYLCMVLKVCVVIGLIKCVSFVNVSLFIEYKTQHVCRAKSVGLHSLWCDGDN
jgi:carbon starvation protein CstA